MYLLIIMYSDKNGKIHKRELKCPDMGVVVSWLKFYQTNEVIINFKAQWKESKVR